MNKYKINDEIDVPSFILISETGQNLGTYKLAPALALAKSKDLDLILVSPNAAKLGDYHKLVYEKKKTPQKTQQIKELKVAPQISDHDLDWKCDQANKWLEKGALVKLVVRAAGRIKEKPELALDVYNKVFNRLNAKVKQPWKVNTENDWLIIYTAIFMPK